MTINVKLGHILQSQQSMQIGIQFFFQKRLEKKTKTKFLKNYIYFSFFFAESSFLGISFFNKTARLLYSLETKIKTSQRFFSTLEQLIEIFLLYFESGLKDFYMINHSTRTNSDNKIVIR